MGLEGRLLVPLFPGSFFPSLYPFLFTFCPSASLKKKKSQCQHESFLSSLTEGSCSPPSCHIKESMKPESMAGIRKDGVKYDYMEFWNSEKLGKRPR